MTIQSFRPAPLWSIVLAGGEGERTRPFVESWLGYHKPKQYCVFSGNRSLFQQTVDRADVLGTPERRVSVVAQHHLDEARVQLQGRCPGILLPQPANRGTAAGVLLALTWIRAVEPSAVAVVYPSDHFVFPEDEFLVAVGRVVGAARKLPDRLVLLGVRPEFPEPDYGWIRPGGPLGSDSVRRVKGFVEKPTLGQSRALMAEGGLWNSLVVAGSVDTFWRLMAGSLPELASRFEAYRETVGTSEEDAVLARVYETMPPGDFSKDVLQRAEDALAVLPLENVLWSDWGRPERIAATLRMVGAEPSFPEEQLEAIAAGS